MLSFVLLNAYRIFCRIIAIFILLLAVVTFVQGFNAFSYSGLDRLLGAFLTALPALALAVSIGVFAELLTLFLSMNDHLAEMKEVQQRTYDVLAGLGSTRLPVAAASPVPISTAPTAAPEAVGPMEAVVSAETGRIYSAPEMGSNAIDRVPRSQSMKLYGRDPSGLWVCSNQAGTAWIRVEDLAIAGDVMDLPVINPPAPTV